MRKRNPLVSIIVHTKDSEKTLKQHLESIMDQTYKNIEIIAVDNFSKDDTFAILKRYTKKTFQFGPERSAQRNFGVQKSAGEYILIPDSDMILSKSVVAECVDLSTFDERVKAIVIPERSFGEGFWAACKILERRCYENDPLIEAARFFDKSVFCEVGGYDEEITGPEDWDLPQRIAKKGYKIGRIGHYILHNEGKLRLSSVVRKKYYYGLQLDKYLKKHSLKKNISQTIYFFRPAFYRNWKLLFSHPITSLGMLFMLLCEQIAGFMGYMRGSLR